MGNRRDPICEQFGRNLRRMRSLAGLSQSELGQRLGITYQQVQKYEMGRAGVSVATMCRLRIILGCEFADLLAGPGVAPGPEGVAGVGPQQQASRMVRAMLVIDDAGVQEGLIRLAQSLAAGAAAAEAAEIASLIGHATGKAVTVGRNRT
jgi:transcriptional regulator with XRE-family HTH domain